MSELYRNAVCLAPMVRAGTLPLRLLSLRYGADLVYGEEIIDKRIISSTRIENTVLKTIDYVANNGDSVVFRTCDEEKGKVVFQIGTADPQLALQAAKHVEQDVAAIDINMGCPKHFSVQGGMGAALLKNQEMACAIVRTLSSNLSIPVSAKIRLLATTEETVAFAKKLQDAGAAAIGLHARTTKERPGDKPHWDLLRPVIEAVSIPVLVNGDIFNREDLKRIQEESGATSFLIARGAMRNTSIFRKEGMLPYLEVVEAYLTAAAETDNVYPNTKYTMSRMLPTKCDEDSEDAPVIVADLYATKTNEQMFAMFGLADLYDTWQQEFQARAAEQDKLMPKPMQPAHEYDDEHVMSQQFFCNLCQLQLTSDQDVALHLKGKRHRNKLKLVLAASRTELVAQSTTTTAETTTASAPAPEVAGPATTETTPEAEAVSHKNKSSEQSEEQPLAKRTKLNVDGDDEPNAQSPTETTATATQS